MKTDRVIELSNRYEQDTINIRRKIHSCPELAFQEFRTSALVCSELEHFGIPYEKSPVEPGIVAIIDSGKPGKLLLLRADMDALPILEAGDAPFRSGNDKVMHACGHDVHTANLLTVGRILNETKELWNGRIKLVFQPGEERGGGGRMMIEKGLLDETPDACLALHVIPSKKGSLLVGSGYLTAYSDGCAILVHGKAAHSSKPQEGVDAINIAASIITALNTVTARSLSPMECSTLNVGMISGGSASNIIADQVVMQCMMRNITPDAQRVMKERIVSLSKSIAEGMGGSCDIEFRSGYPSVYNDPKLTRFVVDTAAANADKLFEGIGRPEGELLLTGDRAGLIAEDFGFYSQKAPSCFIQVGTGEYAPAHSPEFFVDESYIKLCTRLMAVTAMEYLD